MTLARAVWSGSYSVQYLHNGQHMNATPDSIGAGRSARWPSSTMSSALATSFRTSAADLRLPIPWTSGKATFAKTDSGLAAGLTLTTRMLTLDDVRAMRQAGAAQVDALVLARTPGEREPPL